METKTFQTICAQCEKDPCCDWVGEEGAGHFVKMVHNGIEYGKISKNLLNCIILLFCVLEY